MAALNVAVTGNSHIFFGNETLNLIDNKLRLPPRPNFNNIKRLQGFSILLPHQSAPRIILVPKGVKTDAEPVRLELENCSMIGHSCTVKEGFITLPEKLLESAKGVVDRRGKITICGGGQHLALWNSEDWQRHWEMFVEQHQASPHIA